VEPDPYSVHITNDTTSTNAPNPDSARDAYPFEGLTQFFLEDWKK